LICKKKKTIICSANFHWQIFSKIWRKKYWFFLCKSQIIWSTNLTKYTRRKQTSGKIWSARLIFLFFLAVCLNISTVINIKILANSNQQTQSYKFTSHIAAFISVVLITEMSVVFFFFILFIGLIWIKCSWWVIMFLFCRENS
jgi:hypothetical protein